MPVVSQTPIETGTGATITVPPDLATEVVAGIVQSLFTFGVLVVRGQDLTVMRTLAELIGSAEVVLPSEHRYPGTTSLRLQSSRPGVGVDGGGAYWHADGSWLPEPMDVTLLYCLEVPAVGGTTAFVDAAALYDGFDDSFREFVDGVVGVFPNRAVLEADLRAMGLLSPEMLERTRDATHPAVRTHPYTGRRALILNEMWMRGIEGMAEDAATSLLRDLVERAETSSHRYTHRWSPGDLLIWDNHRVLHKADPLPEGVTKTTVRARVPKLAARWLG